MKEYIPYTSHIVSWRLQFLLERFSIAFTANGKRQAEISRLPKTREIYLVSASILPVSHSYVNFLAFTTSSSLPFAVCRLPFDVGRKREAKSLYY